MLVIRFQRAGRKKAPFYRIVVAEKARSVKGRFLEKLGYYNPITNPKQISLEKERIEHWISVGAQPSQSAARLLSKNGISAAEKFIETRVMKPSKVEVEAKKKAAEEVAAKKAAAAEAKKKAEEEKKAAAEAKAAESEKKEETPEKTEAETSEEK